jgi:hypothetical protein
MEVKLSGWRCCPWMMRTVPVTEFAPHRIDGSQVGGTLVAAASQPRGGNHRPLRDAHDFEREDTFQ